MLHANHSSGDKREDDDSCDMLLTGHEPITTQVTRELTSDSKEMLQSDHEPITTQVTSEMIALAYHTMETK